MRCGVDARSFGAAARWPRRALAVAVASLACVFGSPPAWAQAPTDAPANLRRRRRRPVDVPLAIHANARGAQGRLAVFVSTVDGGRHRAPLARVAVEITDPRARLISRQTPKR